MRLLPAVALILWSTTPALAWDEDYRHGRIRYLEPGVTLQRADDGNAEEALVNFPFLPGDRVWTDGAGRVEFQFQDGTLLRLDSRSKLDYIAHEERDDRVILRLWSGSAWLVTRDRGDAYEIETSTAVVLPRDLGTYRIDAEPGETQLSVYEGEATLESGRRSVDVRAGERSWAERGSYPEEPRRFDRRASDDFQSWNESRDDRTSWAASTPSYVPDVVRPYANELDTSGSWYFVADVGHVWRPYVASGWRPYSNGRWVWTYYGWTWVPYETWGWATSHYGRWDYNHGVGWYWIPGRSWGPAWVSWALGRDYVGWCPLGRGDRPVVLGHAVSRGAWNYTRRADMTAHDVARRRVDLQADAIRDLRVADSPRARPTRDTRVLDVQTAVPRSGVAPPTVRMGHSPGDAVPEIAQDNKHAVPAPVVRRTRPREDDERNSTREDPARSVERAPSNDGRSDVATPRRSYSRREETDGEATSGVSAVPRDAGREAVRAPAPQGRERESSGGDRDVDSRPPSSSAAPRSRDSDSDRDVLRRMFRPLTDRPSSSGDSRSTSPRSESPRSEPRSEPRTAAPRSEPRSEPRTAAPRSETRQAPPPRSEPRSAPAPRTAKERDNR